MSNWSNRSKNISNCAYSHWFKLRMICRKIKIQYSRVKKMSSTVIFYSIFSKEISNVLFSHLAAVNTHEDSFLILQKQKFCQRWRKPQNAQIWHVGNNASNNQYDTGLKVLQLICYTKIYLTFQPKADHEYIFWGVQGDLSTKY